MAAPIDMQAPLTRRKALIQKLLAQMAQVTPGAAAGGLGGHAAQMLGSSGYAPMHADTGMSNLVQANVPAGITPDAPQTPPVDMPAQPGAPATGGEQPAPETPAWQQAGFVSEGAHSAFMGMSEGDQTRVMANPVTRRRYFF
jgi:hypothetical protein